jgi:hypothetical protein
LEVETLNPKTLASLALAGVLGAVILIVGYSAVTLGGFMDVGDLAGIRDTRMVTVKGFIVGYSVDGDNLNIVVEGERGGKILAVVSYEKFVSKHKRVPGEWIIGQSITVRGVFQPQGGEYLGVVKVLEILVPCHESYKAPPASG